jgi:hypothetical protein
VCRQALKQALMSIAGNSTDRRDDISRRRSRKKAQPDQRWNLQTASFEIGVGYSNNFIETIDDLMQLTADSTNKQIAKSRHMSQHNRRSILRQPIRLTQ